jgi:glycerophosphoryl diester phosphodiesterase
MLEIAAANTGKVLVIGHRGALAYAPENTMVSFELALEQGADLIELDVHQSADGELVVMHDGEVSRTTDGFGYIKDMTVAEIKELDAGAHFDEQFRGERVPTLPEVLSWAKERIPLVIELKGDPIPSDGIESRLVGMLRSHDMVDRVTVISFWHRSVKTVKELEPDIATGILYAGHLVDTVGAARAALCDSVRIPAGYWTKELVDELHSSGLHTTAWQSEEDGLTLRLAHMGLDSIGTNYPDRMRACLDRNGLGWKCPSRS